MCSSLYHLLDVIVLFFERRSNFFRSLLTKAKAKWKSPISGRIWDNTLYEWKGWLLERNLDADGRQFFMPIFLQFFLLSNALSSFCELQCFQLFYEFLLLFYENQITNFDFWCLKFKLDFPKVGNTDLQPEYLPDFCRLFFLSWRKVCLVCLITFLFFRVNLYIIVACQRSRP